MSDKQMQAYPVWDRTVRVFHWVSVLCIFILTGLGLMLMFDDPLHLGDDSKVVIKTLHVLVGYVFVVTLAWRLLWTFMGSRFSRWGAILPVGKVYKAQWQAEKQARKTGDHVNFKGHSPIARWMISALLLLMTAQAISGLVLSSTFYMPPFGEQVKQYIAETPETVALIEPYSKAGIDPEAYQQMRDMRKPFRVGHEWFFYLLALLIPLHIAAAIYIDSTRRNGVISAMFNGRKFFAKKPFDDD